MNETKESRYLKATNDIQAIIVEETDEGKGEYARYGT